MRQVTWDGVGSSSAEGVLPPLSYTGVETVRTGVSWVAGSLVAEDPRAVGEGLWRDVLQPAVGGEWTISGRQNYSTGFRRDDWQAGVWWDGTGDAAGTVFVELRQQLLDAVQADAARAEALLPPLLDRLTLSRVDLVAADAGRHVLPGDLWRGIHEAATRTHRRRWQLIQSDYGRDVTLTIGSFSSDRMMRVYRRGEAPVRHELQVRRRMAAELGTLLAAGASVRALTAREYARVVSFPALAGWAAFWALLSPQVG